MATIALMGSMNIKQIMELAMTVLRSSILKLASQKRSKKIIKLVDKLDKIKGKEVLNKEREDVMGKSDEVASVLFVEGKIDVISVT